MNIATRLLQSLEMNITSLTENYFALKGNRVALYSLVRSRAKLKDTSLIWQNRGFSFLEEKGHVDHNKIYFNVN